MDFSVVFLSPVVGRLPPGPRGERSFQLAGPV